ncbi:MAG: 3-dehydroquinate dehydratase [Rhodospirillaceae bacterium]|nr:3-dehydroquinate dehydratase [Rhodospirillaceae bacterium]MDD9918535.1 3-dehydroquinate dehydratase [Rhodospirillaceae bacterium]MDD9925733.1 3-dehydroquinate dehydratase [Rhodospirillaceae bacterium]
MTKILLLQGANMVWLGKREPELYGTTTAEELDSLMRERADSLGIQLDIFYANIEGEAIARIYQGVKDGIDGLLMNPAGFTYAGFALRDCIKAVALPYVEVHMTNIERRGTRSVLAEVANGVVAGLGVSSYLRGLDGLLDVIGLENQDG